MTLTKHHGELHWHDGRENPIEQYDYYLTSDVDARIADLTDQLATAQALLRSMTEAVGVATTCAPDMVIDSAHPIEMMQEVCHRFAAVTQERDDWKNNCSDVAEHLNQQLAAAWQERDEAVVSAGWQMADLSATLRQVDQERCDLIAQLATAQARVRELEADNAKAHQIICDAYPLVTITPQDIAWAHERLAPPTEAT